MTDEQKKELFAGLKRHYGAQTEIARRTEYSLTYVREVLGGVRNNDAILTTACIVLREREEAKAAEWEEQMQLLTAIRQYATVSA